MTKKLAKTMRMKINISCVVSPVILFLLCISLSPAATVEVSNHTKVNTPSNTAQTQHILGQDGHDQKDHGITKSASVTPKIVPSKEADDNSEDNNEIRPLTIKEKLRKKLLKSKPYYDKHQIPVKTDHTPIEVKLGMALLHIDIDETESTMTVDAWIRMIWKDEHLSWDKKEFNVSQLHFSDEELWKPDIMLYNNADGASEYPFGKTRLLVFNSGEVMWVPPAKLKAFCKLDLRYWPMDKQRCFMKFASWTAHGGQIKLDLYNKENNVENIQFYTDNREWDILKSEAEAKSVTYKCCNESYPDVTFTFVLQRVSPTYRSVIVLPCLILMLVTGCSFLLTPESGEKLILSGISLVGVLMYLIYFAMSLPFHQHTTPILVSFYSNTAGLIGIAILLNVVCMNMARERKYTNPPKFLLNLFSGCLGKLLCLGNYTHQVSSTHQRLVVELSDMAESEQQTENDIITDSGRNSSRSEIGPNGSLQLDMNDGLASQQGYTSTFTQRHSNRFQQDSSIIMKDWVLVAAGLERLFFVIYGLAFAIVTSVYA